MLPPELAQERILALRVEIQHHNDLYYKAAAPEISDADFDVLVAELRALEIQFNLATPDSPTQIVGSSLTPDAAQEAQVHSAPMLSLAKIFTFEELSRWYQGCCNTLDIVDGRMPCVVEPKIDGAAIAVRFNAGNLTMALTRGDGAAGEVCTENIRHAKGMKSSIPDLTAEFRGEVFMSHADFEEACAVRTQRGLQPFANPRNAAAGTLGLKDRVEALQRPLSVIFYSAMLPDHLRSMTQSGIYDFINQVTTLQTHNPKHVFVCSSALEIWDAIQALGEMRSSLPFATDGVVIKINSLEAHRVLGNKSDSPAWAVAFKFPTTTTETKVKAITWQVGRTGVVVPVAELDAVPLEGSIVSRATLHNHARIRELGLCIGDSVRITKASEIIPEILEVTQQAENRQEILEPTHCPVCSSELGRAGEKAAAVRCFNPERAGIVQAHLVHFAGRDVMDIEGLGYVAAAALVEKKLVKSIADTFFLSAASLREIVGNAGIAATKLHQAIQACKTKPAEKVFCGLGIPLVGRTKCAELLSVFGSIPSVFLLAEPEQIEAAVGPAAAEQLRKWWAMSHNVRLLERLRAAGLQMEGAATVRWSDALAGTTWVVTGKLWMEREELHDIIKRNGGAVKDSVSKKVTHLLVGDNAGGTKLKAADKHGTKIVEVLEFRTQMGIVFSA